MAQSHRQETTGLSFIMSLQSNETQNEGLLRRRWTKVTSTCWAHEPREMSDEGNGGLPQTLAFLSVSSCEEAEATGNLLC